MNHASLRPSPGNAQGSASGVCKPDKAEKATSKNLNLYTPSIDICIMKMCACLVFVFCCCCSEANIFQIVKS